MTVTKHVRGFLAQPKLLHPVTPIVKYELRPLWRAQRFTGQSTALRSRLRSKIERKPGLKAVPCIFAQA